MAESPIAQSVRDRLLHRTRETGEDYQVVLTRFALERLLYRLTQLPESKDFVLKGAFVFLVWEGELGRQTRDLDFLGSGPPDEERLRRIIERACRADVLEDGVEFHVESLSVTPIREGAVYEGLRATLYASIGDARLPVQIDVGFGDTIVPDPENRTFPGLLDFPEPQIATYPPETVVAEKVHGMVHLGRANSRVKDFYDVWRISQLTRFESADLSEAITSTFARRETDIPTETPIALTTEFAEMPDKKRQWAALTRQTDEDTSWREVIRRLRAFLAPVVHDAAPEGDRSCTWPPGGPWTK